jgi:hypothetical protein
MLKSLVVVEVIVEKKFVVMLVNVQTVELRAGESQRGRLGNNSDRPPERPQETLPSRVESAIFCCAAAESRRAAAVRPQDSGKG